MRHHCGKLKAEAAPPDEIASFPAVAVYAPVVAIV